MPLEAVELRQPRLRPPSSLGNLFSDDRYARLSHALGKAYRDVVRGFRGEFPNPPDLVAYPADESEVEVVLSWAEDAGAAVIPYGGGTSVVGGVEPRLDGRTSVSLDLCRLERLLEVDALSLAARIQAGLPGPALEDRLREHGLTLRHFPQSFEFSTLGGWIATRAGGHFATLYTHIDDLVESVRAITPRGTWESRRLPGSGAGPSPDRALIGSEGILGVITDAWVRVRPRPEHKLSCGVEFADFLAGAEAVREISQAGLYPANCRLLDPLEAGTTGAGGGEKALLVLGFESAEHPVDGLMDLAVEIARAHGGEPGEVRGREPSGGEDSVGAWRSAFLGAPYLRDTFVACGVLSDTFETAITWDRFEEFHAAAMDAARRKVAEVCDAPGEGPGSPRVSCRFTHVYPDGPAPYFTVLAPAVRGGEVEQWDEIKAAASEAVIECGGTITHHHAVGRDHRPWYDRQRPGPFAAALRAAKAELDPQGILNPGVLIDPSAGLPSSNDSGSSAQELPAPPPQPPPGGRDANAHEVQDHCGGHPERTGTYHYHSIPSCLYRGESKTKHSGLVGYAYDGFGIYGPRGNDGRLLTDENLDACHGHTHKVLFNGKVRRIYHYHATAEFPYTLGCFRGTKIASNVPR